MMIMTIMSNNVVVILMRDVVSSMVILLVTTRGFPVEIDRMRLSGLRRRESRQNGMDLMEEVETPSHLADRRSVSAGNRIVDCADMIETSS